ncbi:hypothetical protein OIO90_005588 [Microbotryomycetes sp. JL221]|nr:hypothetical protein OIO90_005588 [Microbotryomycetes sp. JL221]
MSPTSFRQLIGLSPSQVSASSGQTALIVVDAQGTYNSGAPLAITGIDAAQKTIAQLVTKYREAKAPVIWIQHDAGDAPIFNLKDASGDFIGDLRPNDGEKIIVKKAPSSFTATDLDETLKKHGIKQIVLTGYMAHVCITGTARSGMEHGYDVVVVKDAIGDRDVPSYDGKSVVSASTLVDTVCHELGDAIGTIVQSVEVKA